MHRNGSSDSSDNAIDRLQYSYSRNKLLAVTDTVTWNTEVGDFRDGNTSGNDYTYWTDGSLKSDANKGISQIEYDSYLKKVKQVTSGNGNWIRWFYDGKGSLLKRENSDGTEWSYSGNTIYKNDTLYQIGISGGRVVLDTNSNFNYAFSENKVIGHIELEGLESVPYYPNLQSELYKSVGVNSSTSANQVGKELLTEYVKAVGTVMLAAFPVEDLVVGGLGLVIKETGLATRLSLSSTKGVSLEARAVELHSKVPIPTQNRTTVAVATATDEAGNSVSLVGSSERRLRPAQRDALNNGEVEVVGSGHAETTILRHANENNLTVTEMAASRPICEECYGSLINQGVKPVSPVKVPLNPEYHGNTQAN